VYVSGDVCAFVQRTYTTQKEIYMHMHEKKSRKCEVIQILNTTHICTHTHIHARAHTHARICVHILADMHTHTPYTHIETYTYAFLNPVQS
jgi:hypothetical protein